MQINLVKTNITAPATNISLGRININKSKYIKLYELWTVKRLDEMYTFDDSSTACNFVTCKKRMIKKKKYVINNKVWLMNTWSKLDEDKWNELIR